MERDPTRDPAVGDVVEVPFGEHQVQRLVVLAVHPIGRHQRRVFVRETLRLVVERNTAGVVGGGDFMVTLSGWRSMTRGGQVQGERR